MGLSQAATTLLKRLEHGGLIDRIIPLPDGLQPALQQHWTRGHTLVVVGAVGAVTRLIAPLIKGKTRTRQSW